MQTSCLDFKGACYVIKRMSLEVFHKFDNRKNVLWDKVRTAQRVVQFENVVCSLSKTSCSWRFGKNGDNFLAIYSLTNKAEWDVKLSEYSVMQLLAKFRQTLAIFYVNRSWNSTQKFAFNVRPVDTNSLGFTILIAE